VAFGFAVKFNERLDSSKPLWVDPEVLEAAECLPSLHPIDQPRFRLDVDI
jgi:hypothetical protein